MKLSKCLNILFAFFVLFLAYPPPAHCQRKTFMEKKCEQESEKGSVRCLEWRALMILAYSEGNKTKTRKAIKILERAHTIAPVDLSILSNIAVCYMQMRDYKTALSCADKILTIKPSFVEIKIMKCMLEERIGYSPKRYRTCYRSVVHWYQNRGKTKDINYVYAVLMLGGPDAEKIKSEYLASLEPGSEQAKMWSDMLKDFDREEYLHKMLP